ncbi:MAG TPA: hypothetical protein PK878_15710 [bacterium]|nr:hypothetical protein [bacterium]
MGTVWTIAHMAKRLDLEKALSVGWPGRLALWQVLARVPDPGSRLSSVRLAQTHAVGGHSNSLRRWISPCRRFCRGETSG